MQSGRVAKILKRAAAVAAILMIASTAVIAAAIWLIALDKVSKLRLALESSTPVAPLVRSAILAAEDPIWGQRPQLSVRAFLPAPEGTVRCGPSPIAFVLVRSISPRRRALLWHVETSIATYVVARIFSPEELLRIYAHELYLGRVAGRSIRGVAEASAVYFGKAAQDLTLAEAATIAAMIRSPNVFSPVKSPARVLERRDKVLALMLRFGFIDERELNRALDEPLRAPTAPDFT